MTEEPPASRMQQLMTTLGAVVAPTSLVTALLYYFGWHHAYWFFDYFGVHSTVLGFSTGDYLMRSLDALFVPTVVAAAAGLLAFWGHDLLRARLAAGSRPRVLRILIPVLAGTGLVLALGGLWSVFAATFLSEHLVLAPLSLAFGGTLLAYTLRLRRAFTTAVDDATAQDGTTTGPVPVTRPGRAAVAEWAVVFVLVGLSLFWAANDYAAAVGRSRAREFVAGLAGYPSAVVYSERGLGLSAPGVSEARCHQSQTDYRFRYDGLKLMLQSGNQYVFLPERWSPADGVAVLIPRTDSVRLEFMRSSADSTAQRPTC